MKLIEAMKKIKDLTRKAEDLRQKAGQHCADFDFETPLYGTEAEQSQIVQGWIQAHHDILKEILSLRISIQKTNLVTPVTIFLGDQPVVKSISEWIHRRRDLANMELGMWKTLGDRGLKEGALPSTIPGSEARIAKIRRYYDPKKRDEMVNLFASEAQTIDATLEVANAMTELIQ